MIENRAFRQGKNVLRVGGGRRSPEISFLLSISGLAQYGWGTGIPKEGNHARTETYRPQTVPR
jgi:hypothetical protein